MSEKKTFNIAVLALSVSMLSACGSDSNDPAPTPEPTNNVPVAQADSASVMVGKTITIDVLANDTDADGDSLMVTSAQADVGSLVVENNKLLYTAGDNPGSVTISYSIDDGKQGSASSTVAVQVMSDQVAYVGTQACLTCHSDKSTFLETGHNFKLNKIVDGRRPTFPFTDVTGAIDFITGTDNTLGAPTSYDEVSYTVGGYHWKMRWLDADGYIVTGTGVQLNLEANDGILAPSSMGGYHAGDVDFKYKCGNCHTTGWKRNTTEDGDNRNLDGHQDGLIGIDGTFAMAGIQCESCHGAGSLHVQNAGDIDYITKNANARTTDDFLAEDMAYGRAVTCGECHTRDGEKDYPSYVSPYNQAYPDGSKVGGRIIVKGGLAQHHETVDELLGVNPTTGEELGKHMKAGLKCTTCHDAHMSTVNKDKPGHEAALTKTCSDCHSNMEFNGDLGAMVHQATDCTSCHMPEMAKSAITHTTNGVTFGDVKSHILTIDLAATEQIATVDGKTYMNPWVTAAYACGECHADYSERAAAIGSIHK